MWVCVWLCVMGRGKEMGGGKWKRKSKGGGKRGREIDFSPSNSLNHWIAWPSQIYHTGLLFSSLASFSGRRHTAKLPRTHEQHYQRDEFKSLPCSWHLTSWHLLKTGNSFEIGSSSRRHLQASPGGLTLTWAKLNHAGWKTSPLMACQNAPHSRCLETLCLEAVEKLLSQQSQPT